MEITVAGRKLETSPVFDTYWRFASARQAVYEARLRGEPAPWTNDPILQRHRFTNCYRAADRVSQFLIREVQYTGSQEPEEVVFRTLLFKMFNRIETWRQLTKVIGEVTYLDFDPIDYTDALSSLPRPLYSAAYVIPPPRFDQDNKHGNHMRLLQQIMLTKSGRIIYSVSLRDLYATLRSIPSLGNFLAYQFAIDLNYSSAINHAEMEFVIPGPGARDGIRKCFGARAQGIESDIIHYMSATQEVYFKRLELPFHGLRGRRLQLIDCQNLFCEVDKYSRVAYPEIAGISGRTKIKQLFRPITEPVPAWFPPKWGING
jgi:alpha-glutamyl/putrescinyl thymine pyrophosphorylase clade 1